MKKFLFLLGILLLLTVFYCSAYAHENSFWKHATGTVYGEGVTFCPYYTQLWKQKDGTYLPIRFIHEKFHLGPIQDNNSCELWGGEGPTND